MHDSLPGTGIDSVYDEMRSAFDKLENTLKKSHFECINKISKILFRQDNKSHQILVFNSVSWDIKEWVEAKINFDIDEAIEIMELRTVNSNEIVDVVVTDLIPLDNLKASSGIV